MLGLRVPCVEKGLEIVCFFDRWYVCVRLRVFPVPHNFERFLFV